MALRLKRLKDSSKLLLHFRKAQCTGSSKRTLYTSSSHFNYLPRHRVSEIPKLHFRDSNYHRYSTTVEEIDEVGCDGDFLTYIEGVIDESRGPSHCWLNRAEDLKKNIGKCRGFLVVSADFLGSLSQSGSGLDHIIRRAKLLQQRYPWLEVFGFQYSESCSSSPTHAHLFQSIMSEYITFPVILSNKTFTEMKLGSYTLFKDFGGPIMYHEEDIDFSVLDTAVRDLEVQCREEPRLEDKLKGSWATPVETTKQPHLPLQNLFFCFPGCISGDSGGNRLFVSDTNHHRIIVIDINGQILDSIGSSPGFEDGDFECAKLQRPASSFYHDAEDCLYFVDSENHAIRKADMETRVVETIYPTTTSIDRSLWERVLYKIRLKREVLKSTEITSESFLFPFHLLNLVGRHLYVLNHSFETLWIVDLDSCVIRETVKGPEKILENCGPMILEKSRLLGQIPSDWFQRQEYDKLSLEGVPHTGLVSSVATLGDHLFVCDTVSQMVLKLDSKSKMFSSLPLSNFGVLGLPYWFLFPFEKVYSLGALSTRHIDHTECYQLLPGRVDIKLNIDIPHDTDLVEPLQEYSVRRQVRGPAIDVSGRDEIPESTTKKGWYRSFLKKFDAQQWYDELDGLIISREEPEEEIFAPEAEVADTKIRIDCSICTSPGESEVVIYAALYLKLKCDPSTVADDEEKKLSRLAELLNPVQSVSRDSVVHLLSKSNKSAEEFVFMRPLHVRLKFVCDFHPISTNKAFEALTNTSVGVNVFLR